MTQPKIIEFYDMINNQSQFPDQKIFQHFESYDFMEGYDENYLDIDCMLVNKYGSWSFIDYNIYGQRSSYLSMLRNFGGYLYTHANNLQRMYDALNLNYAVLDNYNGHTRTTVTESGIENNVTTKTGGNKNEFSISGEKSKEFAISGQKSQEFTFEGIRKDEFAISGSKATTNADTGSSPYQDSVTHKKATDTLSANYVESKDETSTALRSVKSEDTFTNYKETTERSGNNYKETTTDKSSNYKETTTDKSSNYKETTESSFLNNTKDSSVRSFEDRETITEEEKSGNLGLTSSQQLIESEMSLRLMYNFYELLFDDFIKSYFIA